MHLLRATMPNELLKYFLEIYIYTMLSFNPKVGCYDKDFNHYLYVYNDIIYSWNLLPNIACLAIQKRFKKESHNLIIDENNRMIHI